jgi:hypothetical protein
MEARHWGNGVPAAGAAGGTSYNADAVQWFAVGYSNGSALFFRLAEGLHRSRPKEVEKLKELMMQ